MRAIVERGWPLLLVLALPCVAVLIGSSGSVVLDNVTLTATVNLVLVVGLYAFVGTSGVFSFGQIAFMAVGAYVAALLSMPPDMKVFLLAEAPAWIRDAHVASLPAVLLGGVAATILAAVLALPLMRLAGIAAGLAMFAVLNVVFVVLSNLTDITGGSQGLNGVPVATTQGRALVVALICIAVVYFFQHTRFGLRLRSSREDEVAARASGVHVARERTLAFLLSAFIMGVGGGLMAQLLGSFTPQAFYLDITFLTIVMLVVGGKNSLGGAVVGAILVAMLGELLRRLEQGVDVGLVEIPARPGLSSLLLAVVVIAILALRPSGLTGGRELEDLVPAPRWHLTAKPRATRPGPADDR